MWWYVLFVVCLASVSSATNFPVDRETIDLVEPQITKKYLLPGNVKPTHYDITLEPNLDEETFVGTVKIDLTVIEATQTIVLHKNIITFEDKDVLVTKSDQEIKVTKLEYDDDTHFCTITLESELKANDVILVQIDYSGILGRENTGFYIGEYIDDLGSVKKFATTQFESTSAREAFPCFDQPDMKAKFTINIIRGSKHKSISNMPQSGSTSLGPGRTKDSYQTTSVEMSTYLVAFVVYPFDKISSGIYSVYGITHLIKDNRGKYALDNGIKIIEAIQEFLGIDYSLPKLDQVAIPDDYFSAGAMENWGLVTYKQKYLFYKEGLSTASEQQNVLTIIAHEFGHQWFGNIATPKWWNVLWLSEGFATYFEQYAADKADPDMKLMDQYITLVNHVAFESDGSDKTRAMNADVASPDDISAVFDRIAYQKGGAVIRMMEHFLSTDVFTAGLKNYLTDMDQKPAEPADLWKGLQDAVDELSNEDKASLKLDEVTVAEVMETWNSNEGFPVVTAKRDSSGIITLSQDRFFNSKAESGMDTKWIIPINYAEEDKNDFMDTKTQFWLKSKQETTTMQVDTKKWFILNKQETGYYRVNYDDNTWNLIINYLNSDNFEKINVLNRAQLIDDSFNLARSGRLSYEIPLKLSQYLPREKEYVPFAAFFRCIQFLNNHMASSENYQSFKNYVISILQKTFEDLTNTEGDTHVDKLKRANVINWLCRLSDEKCMNAMHNELLSVEETLPDLQTPVYCGGLRLSDYAERKFKKLYTMYRKDSDPEYLPKSRALAGMGCTLDETLLIHFMRAAIGQDNIYDIPEKDRAAAFTSVYTSSDIGLNQAVTFLAERFADVKAGLTAKQINTILKDVASRTSLKEHSEKLSNITDTEFTDVINDAKAVIDANNKFSEEKLEKLKTWLFDTYGSAGFVTVSVSLVFSMLAVLMLI